jgi:hypothetical protein
MSVNVWVWLDRNDVILGCTVVDVEASKPITISSIVDSAKTQFSGFLINGCDFRTYSGLDNEILLSETMVWDVQSHGGGSKEHALLVKFTTPVVAENKGVSAGTCRFCH